VTLSCANTGTLAWTATVHNAGPCPVTAPWEITLQTQRNFGNFHVELTQSGSDTFAPGDTILQGSFCYLVSDRTTAVRVEFETKGPPHSCQVSRVSPAIAPCLGVPVCRTAPGE
jgi:hypothetical protein